MNDQPSATTCPRTSHATCGDYNTPEGCSFHHCHMRIGHAHAHCTGRDRYNLRTLPSRRTETAPAAAVDLSTLAVVTGH
eukprot:3383219-Alexandrium_andersonii.AAC.1